MNRKIREKVNIFVAKSPKKAVLVSIMLFNVVFVLLAAGIIAILSRHLSGLKECSFWVSVYRTITMMLDAGCIESVIEDVGKAGAFAAAVCITVILVGMVFFTGAIIGFVTNSISDFIESKNNGKNKLLISDHIVIINWNSRADEIINEFLYEKKEVKAVVFVQDDKDRIDDEIRNRLDATLMRETGLVYEAAEKLTGIKRRKFLKENLPRDNVTYIVREGDVASAADLNDICISKAKTVIILDDENESFSDSENGNIQTIKTLIQVSEISKANSEQIILVEVSDSWTEELVNRIIEFKSENGKETIIPLSYSRLRGKTYSQIALMPELNDVYDDLFSNRGAHFVSQSISPEYSRENENEYISRFLEKNCRCVPLTVMETLKGNKAFFMACEGSELEEGKEKYSVKTKVRLNKSCTFRKRNIVVYGHNSNMESLMEGFELFRKELYSEDGSEAFSVIMVDDEESLISHNYYKEYPFAETFPSDVYDDSIINEKVIELAQNAYEETTILILSDDSVGSRDVDANVLTYLIYIQGQIRWMEKHAPEFRREDLNVLAEILDPKNEDVVKSYGADKVIVSNRYFSRVISQISLGMANYEFYADMLSYGFNDEGSMGKEIYTENAEDFFRELPGKCSAMELIRAVFAAGDKGNKAILMGYLRNKKDCIFFTGDQREIETELKKDDILILFGNKSA